MTPGRAAGLSNVVLPQYYNHANFKSFVRQLHMYSFRKLQVDSESDWCARARHCRYAERHEVSSHLTWHAAGELPARWSGRSGQLKSWCFTSSSVSMSGRCDACASFGLGLG